MGARLSRRVVLVTIVAALAFAAGAGAQSAGWFIGDEHSSVAGPAGTDDLELRALRDLNASAKHIRLVGNDGNFEFENRTGVSHLNSYIAGTGTRTPLTVGGGDGQNVIGWIVDSGLSQTADIQQWRKNGAILSAIDSRGRLRLRGIALDLVYKRHRLALRATLRDGSTRYLFFR
jgi:hypothetical protein